jgi:AraC-like DNA-binding protein
LSLNYFGDLIKKETGNTALDYIQSRLIDEAKSKIFDAGKTINDIAGELDFNTNNILPDCSNRKPAIRQMSIEI